MNFASVKELATKVSIATFAAGALLFAGTATAQAQQWGVAVQYGTPGYVVDRDDYYRDRAAHEYWERERAREAWMEHERQEEFLRRQAWFRHEQWEREHRYYGYDRDHDHDFYGYR